MDINDYIDFRCVDEIEKEYYVKFIYCNHQETDCITMSHQNFGATCKNLNKINQIVEKIISYKIMDFLNIELGKELIFLAKKINNAKNNKELVIFYNKQIYFVKDSECITNIKKLIYDK